MFGLIYGRTGNPKSPMMFLKRLSPFGVEYWPAHNTWDYQGYYQRREREVRRYERVWKERIQREGTQ